MRSAYPLRAFGHHSPPALRVYARAHTYAGLPASRFAPPWPAAYAIWLLGENLLANTSDYAHDFRLRDAQARPLLDHGGIWLLELNKFHTEQVQTEQERWLKFFKDGEALDSTALPSWMQTPEMTQAMNTLKTFSEKERAYHTYQSRQNYLREQRGIQRHLDELQAEAEQERAAKEQAQMLAEQERAAKEAALAEIERLKAQLHGQGYPK